MKKKILAMAFVIVLAVTFAACGKTGGLNTETSDRETTSAAVEAEAVETTEAETETQEAEAVTEAEAETRPELTEAEVSQNAVNAYVQAYDALKASAESDSVTKACINAVENVDTSYFNSNATTSDGQSLVGSDFAALSAIANYYYDAANGLDADPNLGEVIRSSTKAELQNRTGAALAGKDSDNVVMVEAARIAVFFSNHQDSIVYGDLVDNTDRSVDNCSITRLLNFTCNGNAFIAEFDENGNLCNVISNESDWDTDEYTF